MAIPGPSQLAFTRDASHGDRHFLEWEATAFEDTVLRGVTILTKNDDGKIVHVAIHHQAARWRPEIFRGTRSPPARQGRTSHFYGAA